MLRVYSIVYSLKSTDILIYDTYLATYMVKLTISTTISQEFFLLCKKYHISRAEALRQGVALILAEKGVKEYCNDLNITRQRNKLTDKISELAQEINRLKNET